MTEPLYPISSIPKSFVDHAGLTHLFNFCSQPNARVALIGYNETSKHLVNMCGDNIVGIYDPAEWKTGIVFREKPVVDQTEILNINRIAICDWLLGLDFADQISALYNDKIGVFCPSSLGGKPTSWTNPFEQEQIYKSVFEEAVHAPLTMMGREKVSLLMELLRHGLQAPGDVIEMGVWQGGSAWYLAKILAYLKEERELILIDQFEKLVGNKNATVCNDEVKRSLAFYGNVTMVQGLVGDNTLLSKIGDQRYCFAHYDLGFYASALGYLWDRLSPGAPLIIDNYGVYAALPARCDRFFAERGVRVIRIPWSGQGLVFKSNGAL